MKFQKNNILKNEIWAFIPARSGSKSIKNKNIKKINGKPLIYYSLQLAKKIKFIKKIVFSSNSKKYIRIASKYCSIEAHLRSAVSSSDTATDYDTFREYFKLKIKNKEKLPEYFLHLRPTTPYRKKNIVIDAINYFLKNSKKYSALRSVTKLENSGFRTVLIKKKKLFSLFNKSFYLDPINKARQLFKNTYIPNGYVDIIKTMNISKNYLHGNKVYGYITKDYNTDFDNEEEFKKTKAFLSSKKKFF